MPATSAERSSSARVREKSPDAFRTISEVATLLDVPAHVLRFWESKFTQIKPIKRGGGRRYYRPNDINLLRGIRDLLYSEGMTIKGVQKILREQGVKHVTTLGAADGKIRRMTDTRKPATTPPRPEQGDLFGAEQRAPALRTTDREALRSVVNRLEALRDAMKAQRA